MNVVIQNPVLNSPLEEPKRYFKFTEVGSRDEVIEVCPINQYFVATPCAKTKRLKELSFETEWTANELEENKDNDRIYEHVEICREGGQIGITKSTSRSIEYWKRG